MQLLEFLLHSSNYLFTGALVLMLFIAFLEGALTLIGIGVSQTLDSFFPDYDLDIDADVTHSSLALSSFYDWLRIKKVPIIMLLVIFLTSFGVIGLSIQAFFYTLTTTLCLQIIVFIPSFVAALYCVHLLGALIAKVLPKDESSSISDNDLVGHIATIVLGKAKKNFPAEAKTKDIYGQTHYFMVEPSDEGIEFLQGEKVLLLTKEKTYFTATNDLPEKLK